MTAEQAIEAARRRAAELNWPWSDAAAVARRRFWPIPTFWEVVCRDEGAGALATMRVHPRFHSVVVVPVRVLYPAGGPRAGRSDEPHLMLSTPRSTKIAVWCIAALLCGVLVVKTLFIDYYRIPQNGMYPGLPAGALLFAAKRPYSDPSQVKRGDIVVFIRDEDGQRYHYIWRVVGLPGDTIAAVGESLTINGQPLAHERVREEDDFVIFREHAGDAAYEIAVAKSPGQKSPDASVTVPPDHFFVMGDNRSGARDSRSSGPIAFSAIVARKL